MPATKSDTARCLISIHNHLYLLTITYAMPLKSVKRYLRIQTIIQNETLLLYHNAQKNDFLD